MLDSANKNFTHFSSFQFQFLFLDSFQWSMAGNHCLMNKNVKNLIFSSIDSNPLHHTNPKCKFQIQNPMNRLLFHHQKYQISKIYPLFTIHFVVFVIMEICMIPIMRIQIRFHLISLMSLGHSRILAFRRWLISWK